MPDADTFGRADMQCYDTFAGSGIIPYEDRVMCISQARMKLTLPVRCLLVAWLNELTSEFPFGLVLLSNRTSHHTDAVVPRALRAILMHDLHAKSMLVRYWKESIVYSRRCSR